MAEEKNIIKPLTKSENVPFVQAYDEILTRMAIEEIHKDIARKSIRAEIVGPSAWRQTIPYKTNKRFLRNTLKNAITHNTRKLNKSKESSFKKFQETFLKSDRNSNKNSNEFDENDVICID